MVEARLVTGRSGEGDVQRAEVERLRKRVDLESQYRDLCAVYHKGRQTMTSAEREAISAELARVKGELDKVRGGDRG